MHVILVEDDALARDSYADIIHEAGPGVTVHECTSLADALRPHRQAATAAMVVVDHGMLAAAKGDFAALRARAPRTPVVVASGPNGVAESLTWLDLGAAGYIPRTMRRTAILQALRLVLAGERYIPSIAVENWREASLTQQINSAGDAGASRLAGLTPRQRQVLVMLANGAPNKVIARHLDIHEVTVKSHLRTIYRLLGVSSRTQAAREAMLAGIAAQWIAVGDTHVEYRLQ
ncbi:MAG: LuxR C-terminal-related transcriptional regulator [Actinomycetota bacterium]